jgi:predicted dehydrogenase
MTRIRVGVLGAGWGAGLHLEGFRAIPEVELTAISSRTRARAESLAADYGVAKVLDDPRELIDSVDVVSVATPPDSHLELASMAARAGRHVLCDKPLTVTADEARRLLDAVRLAGVRHATGFIWRGDEALRRMRLMLRAGDIGRPVQIDTTCALGLPVLPMNWMYLAESGGGALAQHGSHVIDRAAWLIGQEIAEVHGGPRHDLTEAVEAERFHHVMDVFAWAWEHLDGGEGPKRPVTADTGYEFSAVFTDGTCARFWEAWHRSGRFDDHVVVHGTDGTLEWCGAEGLRLYRIGADTRVVAGPSAGSGARTRREIGVAHWVDLATQFITAIRGDACTGYPTIADGEHVAAVSDAVRRSGTSRRWEAVRSPG